MTRRNLVATNPVTASATRAQKFGTAFLGVSHSHTRGKLEGVRTSPFFQRLRVRDNNEYGREGLAVQELPVAVPEVVMGDPAIAAVVADSGVPDHRQYALVALSARKHVRAEKPLSSDVAGLWQLLDLASRKKQSRQQGKMWSHHPNPVRSAAVGEVDVGTAVIDRTLGADRRPEWTVFRGGQGLDLISPLARPLGCSERIFPFPPNNAKSHDSLAGNTLAVFEFPGSVDVLMGSALQPDGNRRRRGGNSKPLPICAWRMTSINCRRQCGRENRYSSRRWRTNWCRRMSLKRQECGK